MLLLSLNLQIKRQTNYELGCGALLVWLDVWESEERTQKGVCVPAVGWGTALTGDSWWDIIRVCSLATTHPSQTPRLTLSTGFQLLIPLDCSAWNVYFLVGSVRAFFCESIPLGRTAEPRLADLLPSPSSLIEFLWDEQKAEFALSSLPLSRQLFSATLIHNIASTALPHLLLQIIIKEAYTAKFMPFLPIKIEWALRGVGCRSSSTNWMLVVCPVRCHENNYCAVISARFRFHFLSVRFQLSSFFHWKFAHWVWFMAFTNILLSSILRPGTTPRSH